MGIGQLSFQHHPPQVWFPGGDWVAAVAHGTWVRPLCTSGGSGGAAPQALPSGPFTGTHHPGPEARRAGAAGSRELETSPLEPLLWSPVPLVWPAL